MELGFKRVAAYFLDVLILSTIALLLTSLSFINPYQTKYSEVREEYNELIDKYEDEKISSEDYEEKLIEYGYKMDRYSIVNASITTIILLIYFGIIQYFTKGETIGKKIFKLKLVHKDQNSKLKLWQVLVRSILINNILFRIILIIGVLLLTQKPYSTFATTINLIMATIESAIFVMVMLRNDGRGLHDILAKTKVISTKNEEIKTA